VNELTPDGNKSLDGLEEDGQAEGEKEYAIEEGAKELSACPTEGRVMGGLGSLRDLMKRVSI
jgi:hypothetical protein